MTTQGLKTRQIHLYDHKSFFFKSHEKHDTNITEKSDEKYHASHALLCATQDYTAISERFFSPERLPRTAPHLSSGKPSRVRRARDKPETLVEQQQLAAAMLKVGGSAWFTTP